MSIGSRSATSYSQQTANKEAEFLIDHVGTALQLGLAAIQTYRPKDPIEYLARYLYKYVENENYQKQMEMDEYNLQQEILLNETELKLAKEREEEKKRLLKEEEEIRKTMEIENKKRKEEEEKARMKADEEAKSKAEFEAAIAAEALLKQAVDEVDGEKDESIPIVNEDGKLPPVDETDELEYSTREPTKITEDNEEEINEDAENLEDPNINEEPEE